MRLKGLQEWEAFLAELNRLKKCEAEDRDGEVWDLVCSYASLQNIEPYLELEQQISGARNGVATCRARKWEDKNWRGLYI
jgi:hypothetical protein